MSSLILLILLVPPPPLMDSINIPLECPSPECDRFQTIIDDTIVKPPRLVNRTLGNLTQMSFVSHQSISILISLSLSL